MTTSLYFLATVEFDEARELSDLAAILTEALGLDLVEELDGRFDEVPAYVAVSGALELVLFGPPDDHDERACVLRLMLQAESMEAIEGLAPETLRPIFRGPLPETTGYIDRSKQLAEMLNSRGLSDCVPVAR